MHPLLTPDTVAIVVAVREELRAICAQTGALAADGTSARPIYSGDMGCTPVVITATGMGRDRAYDATARLLRERPCAAVIAAGFAGGLAPGISAGDLIVPALVQRDGSGPPAAPASDLLECARRALADPPAAHAGPLATLDAMCVTAADKAAARDRHPHAIAADMETYGAAAAAADAGVPWLAIRAITDGSADVFPLPFDRYVDACGEPDRTRIMLAALRSPASIPGLIRLGRCSASAAGNLARAVEATVRAMYGAKR